MKFESFIARRYLSSGSFSAKLLKWIGLIGVSIGVFSLVVVLAVMRGFEEEFAGTILGFQAHLTLEGDELPPAWPKPLRRGEGPTPEELRQYESIVATERWVEGELVIQSTFGTSAGSRIRGIVDDDVSALRGVKKIYLPIRKHLRGENEESLPGIVLGSELAALLEVHPDFKDEVRLVFPFGDLSPTGELLPRVRRFRVIGIFESGFYEYDTKYAFIAQEMAERLLGEYGREKVALFLRDPMDASAVKERMIAAGINEKNLSTWQEQNRQLFQALLLERIGMFILLLMIVLIASFNIFSRHC